MFTGIVTDIGRVETVEPLDHGRRFRIATAWDTGTIDIGASIAHAGTCLTVVARGPHWFETEAWEEALRLTTLGDLAPGSRLNLERSLKLGDELGGHMVSGHVDGRARILTVTEEGGAVRFTIEAPASLARFIAPKGSVALDGTSLTVNGVTANRFDVLLIRHTLQVTTWGDRKVGDELNLEVDVMARYAARLTEFDAAR
ncbi:MAG: riboflavin synthase [Rhizobiaceae bacterium]